MRDEWNEELRRAYDRGYWDARREFEHHLKQSHSGEFRTSRETPGFMGEGGGQRGDHGGQHGYRQERERENQGRSHRGGEYGSDQGRYGNQGEYGRGQRDHRHDDDRHRGSYERGRYESRHSGGGGRPESHERGFFEKIGDEVSSWFDDDDRNRNRTGLSRDYDRDVTGYRNR